jgi:hypothetical protein
MRRRITVAILAGAFAPLIITVPRWTAAKVEAKRETDFRAAVNRAVPSNLPPCPLPGPELDAFLERSAAALKNSAELWLSVCRIAPLPAHRIAIIAKTRSELNGCRAGFGSESRPVNVICVSEEPLDFLADAKASRTWARREDNEVIWITSGSMAWREYLVSEHRQWMMLGLMLTAASALLVVSAQRTRQAFAWRAACHFSGEPDVPPAAEFVLHWALGRRCRSLPGDLNEEYAWMLENGISRKQADQWYRWQVFHSIAPVTTRRVEAMLAGGFWRGLFTPRG